MNQVTRQGAVKSPFEYSLTQEQLVSKEIIFSWDSVEAFFVKRDKKDAGLFLYQTTQQNKLFLIVLCAFFNVNASFDNDGVVGFKTSCLLKLLGYTPQGQTSLNNLIKRMNVVTENKNGIDVTNIFPKITSIKRGYTYFKMTQEAVNYFVYKYAVNNNFLNYQLHCVLKLKSEHSINLYELFKLKEYIVIEDKSNNTKKTVAIYWLPR